MIHNVHERVVTGTPDEVWTILADVSSLYPSSSGKFELPEGLHPGAPVVHDGTRYQVASVDVGRRLWFDMGKMLSGGHGFELFPCGAGTLVRHTIQGRPSMLLAVMWPLLLRRQHEKAIEGTLANLARATARAESPLTP